VISPEDLKWIFDDQNTDRLYDWAALNPARYEGAEWLEIARRNGYYKGENEKSENTD